MIISVTPRVITLGLHGIGLSWQLSCRAANLSSGVTQLNGTRSDIGSRRENLSIMSGICVPAPSLDVDLSLRKRKRDFQDCLPSLAHVPPPALLDRPDRGSGFRKTAMSVYFRCGGFLDSDPEISELWVPFALTLLRVGVTWNTMLLTRDILLRVHRRTEKGGVAAVAGIITSWQLLVREILSDEEHTRVGPGTHVPFTRVMRRSRRIQEDCSNCRYNRVRFYEAAEYQGKRGIPIFLLDPFLVAGLHPNATLAEKARLVDVSNIKRLLPAPKGVKRRDTFRQFVECIEDNPVALFDFYDSCLRYCRENFRPNYVKKVSLSLNSKASLTNTQLFGGKVGEAIDQVVNGFMELKTSEVIPEIPEEDLYFLGIKLMSPYDWSKDKPIWQTLFLGSLEDRPELSKLDSRFGLFLLYWSVKELRLTEGVDLGIPDEFGGTLSSYDPHAEIGVDNILETFVKCRVVILSEEGWKTRLITIVSLAVDLIGQAGRQLGDHSLDTDFMINLGMKSRVKLYSVMEKLVGRRNCALENNYPNLLAGLWAMSVDLENATNCPSRKYVSDVLQAFRDAKLVRGFPALFNLAVSLSLMPRNFVYPGFESPEHNSGIMMGEGLCGLFLNVSSGFTRALSGDFLKAFPHLSVSLSGRMDNQECDAFILDRYEQIQEFLHGWSAHPEMCGSNSGDDSIMFAQENLGNAMRVIYRMQGMRPSQTTWFNSKSYATFTEESAIQTADSGGWRFIDSVKPKCTQTSVNDPNCEVLPSKMRLLSSYMAYRTGNKREVDVTNVIAHFLIQKDFRWRKCVAKNKVPIGSPSFLGGLDHPCGLDPLYKDTISQEDANVMECLSSMDPVESYALILEDQVLEKGAEVLKEAANIIKSIISDEGPYDGDSHPIGDYRWDLRRLVPQSQNAHGNPERFADWVNRRNAYARANGLVSASSYLNDLVSKVELLDTINGTGESPNRNATKKTEARLKRLRGLALINKSVAPVGARKNPQRIKMNIKERADTIVFHSALMVDFERRHSFPGLSVMTVQT